MSMVPVIVAAQAAQQQEAERALIDAFRLAGATAPERAQTLDRLGLTHSDAFERLRKAGVLRSAERSRYYLDEAAVIARRQRDQTRPAAVFIILGLLVLLVLAGIVVLVSRR